MHSRKMVATMPFGTGAQSQLAFRRMMVFIDGENLVRRYEDMKKKYVHKPSVVHRNNVYAWHPHTIEHSLHEILRATYYTSSTGNDEVHQQIRDEIRKMEFPKHYLSGLPTSLSPWVGKRTSDGRSKAVDIRLVVDTVLHCHADNLDTVYLVTGDGDFLPVIKEAIRSGKQVHLAALSSGLNPKLRDYVDRFIDLDRVYFDITEPA